jgi:hypothetical protein
MVTTTTSALLERAASVLVGYHTVRRGRVELAYLGGVVFVFDKQTQTVVETIAIGACAGRAQRDRAHDGATAEVRLDADIALTRRVSIVPQLRMVADGVSVPSGAALRALVAVARDRALQLVV